MKEALQSLYRWLSKNKEWLFSGIGVLVITTVISAIFGNNTTGSSHESSRTIRQTSGGSHSSTYRHQQNDTSYYNNSNDNRSGFTYHKSDISMNINNSGSYGFDSSYFKGDSSY